MSGTVAEEREVGSGRYTWAVRVSPFSYAIWSLALITIVLIIMSLVMSWGRQPSTGEDIKAGVYGLLPWFLLVPVFLEAAFPLVQSRILQVLYIVGAILLSAGLLLLHYLGGLSFETEHQAGFYLVYAACALSMLQCLLMAAEAVLFGRMRERGAARSLSLGRMSSRA